MVRLKRKGGSPKGPPAGSGATERGRWLESLLHDLDAIVWEADAQTWQFTFVGGRTEAILGYPVDDWLASPTFWLDHVHPDDRDAAALLCRTSTDAGRDHDFEYRAIAADGRVVWIRDIIRVLCDDDGRPKTLRGLMVDVTNQKETEQALRESEERFQFLSDLTLEGVVVHDDGVIVEANRAFAELFGYSRTELLGMRVQHLAAPESLAVLADRMRNGSFEPYEAVGRRKDGSSFVAALVGSTVQSRGRTLRVVTVRDITEQRRAEQQLREAEARYRTLVEQLPASVFVSDARDGSRILYMSPSHERLTGYSLQEYLADPYFWRQIVHPEDRDWVVGEASRTDRTGEAFVVEYRLVRKDGEVVWVHEHSVLVRGPAGEHLCWQGVMLDITERKLAEEQADQELGKALAMEREASQRLRVLDEMKNTFLEAVSHDLRTPLTAILGTALTLERDDLPLSIDQIRELTRRIAANARKLDRLLSDLLDLDRLSRGILEPKRRPLDVSALVRQLVVGTEVLGDRPVIVEGDDVVGVLDAAKVERIVENLLSNAARHTDPGARIWVRVTRRPEGVLIAVEDEGTGIPEQLRAGVFQPFQQGDGPKHAPGVGIGLSLVARFAEMHGGRAWVDDREGGGASFKVLLPDAGTLDSVGASPAASPPSVGIEAAEQG